MPDPQPDHQRTMHYGLLNVQSRFTGEKATVQVNVEIDLRKLGIEQHVQQMMGCKKFRRGLMNGAVVIAITEST